MQRIARVDAIEQAENAERIFVFQLSRQCSLREILVADRPHKAVDSLAADRGVSAVAGGRIRSPVHHGVADFNPGGKAVDHKPAGFALEN